MMAGVAGGGLAGWHRVAEIKILNRRPIRAGAPVQAVWSAKLARLRGYGPRQRLFGGRFELIAPVGSGGMGAVWCARDRELGLDVALKLLPLGSSDCDELREALRRETRHALRLTHPHIVRVHTFLVERDDVAVAMEWVAGRDAGRILQRLPFQCADPDELGPWIGALCDALDHAHRESVLHLDVKPRNLLIAGDGALKLGDFGISRSFRDCAPEEWSAAQQVGSLEYLSPDVLMGRPPSAGDDIYALGATLFHLVAGEPPFGFDDSDDGAAARLSARVLAQPPPSVRSVRSRRGHPSVALPHEWEDVIAACLTKEAACRPKSAGEVAARMGVRSSGQTWAESVAVRLRPETVSLETSEAPTQPLPREQERV